MNRIINLAVVVLSLLPALVFAESVFQPNSCEYRVSFPGPPEIATLYTPGAGSIQSATYYVAENETFLQAECFPWQSGGVNMVDLARSMIVPFAESVGIENAEYEFQRDTLGLLARARGFKAVDGKHTAIQIMIYFGKSSYITLYMSGASSTFPASEVEAFIDSIKK